MSKIERDLAKAQAVVYYTDPIKEMIKKLPKHPKYTKAKNTLHKAIAEIQNAAISEG